MGIPRTGQLSISETEYRKGPVQVSFLRNVLKLLVATGNSGGLTSVPVQTGSGNQRPANVLPDLRDMVRRGYTEPLFVRLKIERNYQEADRPRKIGDELDDAAASSSRRA